MPYEIDWSAFWELSDQEQEAVSVLLGKIEEGANRNPLLFFFPYKEQAEFLASRNRFKWMLGGNRSGKTIITCIDDLIQALDRDAVPEHLLPYKKWEPPFKWRIVAPDFDAIELVIMEEVLKRWCPPGQLLGGSWKTAYNKERRVVRFKNGSLLQFKTYEQAAFNHGGLPLHRVHFDEEPPFDIYKEGIARLVDYGGDILCSMTPVNGISWMYDKFYVPSTKGLLTNSKVLLVDMDMNPHLNEEAKKATLAEYSDEERAARKSGKFVALHGLVYPNFKHDHIIPQVSAVPEGAQVYVGIDPGMRHMAAVVFAYQGYDEDLVVFDEIAAKGATADDVAKMIQEKLAYWSIESKRIIKPQWYVIDPSARNLMHNTGRSLQDEYARAGVAAFPGQNDVRAGINAVKVRFDHDKLHICANAQTTIDEFRTYRWSKPFRASENEAKEAPVKRDDHLLDALRYLVMARPYVVPVKTNTPVDPAGNALTGADLVAFKDRNKKHKKDSKNPAWAY
jgi:phage terminase large subunit-like protein